MRVVDSVDLPDLWVITYTIALGTPGGPRLPRPALVASAGDHARQRCAQVTQDAIGIFTRVCVSRCHV